MIETILTILGSSTITAVLTSIFNRKSMKIKNMADNDSVLINRINFLEGRIENLESNACFKKNCKDRV